MRKRTVALLCAFALLLLSGCAHETPQAVPAAVAEGAKRNAEAAYTLELTYDEEQHTLSGRQSVSIKNTSGSTWLELVFNDWPSAACFTSAPYGGYTEFSNVRVGDAVPSRAPVRDADEPCVFRIVLDTPMESGESVCVEWDMLIHIPESRDRFGVNEVSCNLGSAIPLLALWRAGSWVTHPYSERAESAASECADFDITLHAPQRLFVVCTGESVTDEGVTRVGARDVRDFCAVLSDKWHVAQKTHGGVLIRSYYTGSFVMGIEALNAAADALDICGAAVGKYPYTTLDIVTSDIWAAGLEYPQLILMNAGYYKWSGELLRGYTHDFFRVLVAHETAHQWFYGVIGNDQYDEAWIDEGFTTFLESVYAEYKGIRYSAGYVEDVPPLDTSIGDMTENDYQGAIYTCGRNFLIDIRDILGDEAMNDMLSELYISSGFTVADTEDVLACILRHTPPQSMDEVQSVIEEYFTNKPA